MKIPEIDIYDKVNYTPMIVSIALFFLYMLVTIVDINTAIKEFAISDGAVSSFKFLYSYIAGFVMFFIKITISLFTLYLLLTIIRISIVIIFNVFRPVAESSLGRAEFQQDLFTKVKHAISNNALWVFGIYFMEKFIGIFMALTPILFTLIILTYSIRVYISKRVATMQDQEKVVRVMGTLHNQTMFFMVFCIFSTFIYFVQRFFSKI